MTKLQKVKKRTLTKNYNNRKKVYKIYKSILK